MAGLPTNSVFYKKPEEQKQSTGKFPWQEATPATTTVKSDYQQNVAQPVQEKWYKGDQPTTRETLGQILRTTQQNKEEGLRLQNEFSMFQQDPTSIYYAPYTRATNMAVGNLSTMGIDTSNINDEWFEQTAWLSQYLVYNGTTNTPSSPGKKATPEQKAAYEWYQIGKADELTRKAQQEWKALQQEAAYWTQRADRNYSDDQIVEKIYNNDFSKKYPTLAKMDESLTKRGESLLELNSPIDYSKDAVYATIWAARNNGGTGNIWQDMAWSALGDRNTWQENPEITARLNWENEDTYAPYTVGSTLEQEALYYNMNYFPRGWVDSHRPSGNDKTENEMWNKVRDAEDFTLQAEQEVESLTEWLNKTLQTAEDPEKVMNRLDTLLAEKWKSLKKMDDSTRHVDDLIPTTRAIGYSYNDVKRLVYDACAKNGNNADGWQTMKDNGADAGPEQARDAMKAGDKKVSDAGIALEDDIKDSEKNVFWNAPSGYLATTMNWLAESAKNPYNLLRFNENKTTSGYTNNSLSMLPDVQTNQQARKQLDAVNAELETIAPRMEAIENIEGISARQYANLITMTQDEKWNEFLALYADNDGVLMHPSAAMKNPATAEKLDQAYQYIYQKVYADDPSVYGFSDMDVIREKAAQWWDVLQNSEGIDPLTLEEVDRYEQLTSAKAQLEDTIANTDASVAEYEKQQKMWDSRIALYDAVGLDSTGLKTARAVGDMMASFGEYEATEWSAYNAYDMMMMGVEGGASFEDVRQGAQNADADIREALENARFMKEYMEENGIQVPENYMANLDRYIAKLERYTTDYDYFVLQGESDFKELADKGRELEKELKISPDSRLEVEDENGYSLGQYMTDTEKDTYYYLLAKYGEEDPDRGYEEAMKYYGYLGDPTYGVLGTRTVEAYEEDAKKLVNENPVWANVLAILASPMEGVAGLAYIASAAISGNELNPDSPLLALGKFSQTVNEETSKRIEAETPEGPLRDIAMGAYEIVYNRGRSMANMAFTGGLHIGGRFGSVLTEIVGALPMATGAAAMSIAEAKEKGADDGTAYLIGGVTLIMESATEGLTYGNISEAFSGSDDEIVRNITDLAKNWLLSSGLEEAFGETLTDYVENYVDENFLGVNSDHAARVQKYLEDYGLNPDNPVDVEKAEEMARKDELAGLIHTAIISYLSPGLDVITGTVSDKINDFNNIRMTTRELQQQGMNVSMSDVRQQYKEWKAQAMREAQNAPAQQEQTEQAVQDEQAAQEQQEEAPAQEAQNSIQAPVQEEQRTPSAADNMFIANLGKLDAVADSDTTTQVAAIGSLFGGEEGTVTGDTAKAAAANITNIFSTVKEAVENLKGLMMGARNAGVAQQVSEAIQTAALSESSQAAAVMESEDFQNASAEEQAVMLADTTEEDQQNQTVLEELADSTYEYRISEAEAELIRNGALDAMKQVQADAEQKQRDLQMAQESLAEKQAVLQAKTDALAIVTEEFNQNPTNDNQHAMDRALNEVVSASAVEQEYEQHLDAVGRANTEAQTKLKDVKETMLRDVRQQAEQAVAEQDQQRAEEQKNADEQKQYEQALEDNGIIAKTEELNEDGSNIFASDEELEAMRRAHFSYDSENGIVYYFGNLDNNMEQAITDAGFHKETTFNPDTGENSYVYLANRNDVSIETLKRLNDSVNAQMDERTGKTQEEEENAKIDAFVDSSTLDDEAKEQVRKQLKDRRDQINLGKVDMTGRMTDAESMLALGALSRKLNLPVVFSDDLGNADGKYANGVVYLNQKKAANGTMRIGHALVETALHEFTHGLELTKNYGKYRDIAVETLYGSGDQFDQNAYDLQIQQKIDQYKRNGVTLTPAEAEKEIVADFTKKHLANKESIQRFMDAGMGGNMRNTLHNINQGLKNFFAKLRGEDRTMAENLRRAERAFQKALVERANTLVHPDAEQFSVAQFAQATNMKYDEKTQTLYDPLGRKVDGVDVKVTRDMISMTPVGKLVQNGLTDDVCLDENGQVRYEKDADGNDILDANGQKIPLTQKNAANDLFAGLMNMVAMLKDQNMVWEIAGSTLESTFSALKDNSDKQYHNTIDFGTICAKTQAIVNVMSEVMMDRLKANKIAIEEGRRKDVSYGLTREDILKIYDETHKAGLSVPCPVCYVFSRWMGVPSLLGQMGRFQHDYIVVGKDADGNNIHYGDVDPVMDENGYAIFDREATKAEALDYVSRMLSRYGDKEGIDKRKTKINSDINSKEKKHTRLAADIEKYQNQLKDENLNKRSRDAAERRLAKAREDIEQNARDTTALDEELREVEAYNWITQALLKQNANGEYEVDEEFRITPDEILMDLRRTGEFADRYSKNWTYRTTRGAGMGKAILPYSGASLGDIILGSPTRMIAETNPLLNGDEEQAKVKIEDARDRAKRQNLIGGQRLQSTSDFRPEWGLDYIMSFLELQAAKSCAQMYTKVAEAVDLFASVGADVNLSIMGAGNGYHEATAEELAQMTDAQKAAATIDGKVYVMDFSDVTGMRYYDEVDENGNVVQRGARHYSKKYNNVQMILVGMNDIHIRLAMASGDIDFIIPWHSSGNSKDILSTLVASVEESLETSSDYTKVQSDKFVSHKEKYTGEDGKQHTRTVDDRTDLQKTLWDARIKILTGMAEKDVNTEDASKGGLTQEEYSAMKNNPYLMELYERFYKREGDKCYHVALTKSQAGQIFPYEYWQTDTTKAGGTKDTADENGWRFIEYCQTLGVVPRFSGEIDTKTKKVKSGNFAGAVYDSKGNIKGYDRNQMAKGYWKLLIDRKMYDNNTVDADGNVIEYGKYRDQQTINVTNINIGSVNEAGQISDDSMLPKETSARYGIPKLERQAAEASEKIISKPFDLTGQNLFSSDFSEAELDDMLRQAGVDYQNAVQRGDMEAAQEAEQYIQGDVEDRRNAIYIKDGHKENGEVVDFVSEILDGRKKGETRTHKGLSRSQWLGLAKDGQVYGRVILGEPRLLQKYDSEGNYTQDYIDSMIEGTEYDIADGETKYYYPIVEVEDFRSEPQPILRNGNYGQYSVSDEGSLTDAELDDMLRQAGVTDLAEVNTENENLPGPPTTLPGQYVEEGGNAYRQFGRQTAQESNALHDDVKEYLYNHSSYTRDTNQAQIDRAIDWVRSYANEADPDGFFGAMQAAQRGDFDSISADGQARMLTLMSMAALKGEQTGDHSSELLLADMFNKQGTEAGRALQARKIFRLMTPIGRMATLNRMADQINEVYSKKGVRDKNGNERRVALSEWTLQAAAVAETEEDFQKVRDAAAKELAEQMPANWKEKLQAWRMLSMLGNPRTHVRNVVGNAIFMPAVGLKNKIGAGLEAAFIKDGDRTKTLGLASRDARAFAREDVKEMASVLRGESKYKEGNAVQQERKMFGQGNGMISRTLGRAMQGLSDLNSWALEAEDGIFLNRHYQNALAGYMTANKLTSDDMTGDTLEKARAYAVSEAQKATYRDFNGVAQWLSNPKIANKELKGTRFLINAVLPFKKTPANILKRGVEYSPVSIFKSLTFDAKHLKDWRDYQNGKLSVLPENALSPNQYIDRLASGLSGTAIMALGALLGSLGAVKVGLDDDDDEFEKLQGSQEYSIELFGKSYTIDWAAPVCMPFFVGATIMEEVQKSADEKGEDFSIGKVLDSILGITEPVFNLSMLDGVNSILNTSQYAEGNNITQIGEKIISNYATSYVPTFVGQVARTIDTTRRKSYVESGADLSVFRSALEQVENKIPWLSNTNIPYRNVWGEADVSSTGWAAIENFISPGYGNELKNDPVTKELQRLYQETKDPNMIPKAASKTVSIGGESVKLNAEQYDQYVVDRGQTAKQCLTELMESPVWQICDDNTRAMMVSDAWTYANQIARHNLDRSGKLDSWVSNAAHNGSFVDTVVERAAETNRKDYIKGYGQTMAEAMDSGDGEMYELSLYAMDEANATEAEMRAPLRDYFKPLYQQAFEDGDEDTMEEITWKLLEADVGFKEKDIRSWLPSEEEEETEIDERWLNMSNR